MVRLDFGLPGPVQAFAYEEHSSTFAAIIGSQVVCSQEIEGGKSRIRIALVPS